MQKTSKFKRAIAFVALSAAAASAAALPTTPGNLLVSDLDAGVLNEYTRSGSLVQQFNIPAAGGYWHDLRDVVQGSDGQIHMFNGTFSPALTTLNPTTGAITNRTFEGWSTANNISYGGIAVQGNYAFVTDMFTYGGGEPSGIVRFDLTTGSAVRFAEGTNYDDLTLGLDGLLYAGLSVYDPITLSQVRSLSFYPSGDVRGMAVNAAGDIFTADWHGRVARYNSQGQLLGSVLTGESLTDIDINAAGELVLGSRSGTVLLADQSLSGFSSFQIGSSYGPTVHVAFTAAPVPEPTTYAMLMAGLGVVAFVARRKRKA